MKNLFLLIVFLIPFLVNSQSILIDQRGKLSQEEISKLQIDSTEAVTMANVRFVNLDKEFPNGFEVNVYVYNIDSDKWILVEVMPSMIFKCRSLQFVTERDGDYQFHFQAENELCSIVKTRYVKALSIGSRTDFKDCPE